jgi:hypothetical protein
MAVKQSCTPVSGLNSTAEPRSRGAHTGWLARQTITQRRLIWTATVAWHERSETPQMLLAVFDAYLAFRDGEIRSLLAWSKGNRGVHEPWSVKLHGLVYHHLVQESLDQALQTWAIVYEACLRLVDPREVRCQNRVYFKLYAIARCSKSDSRCEIGNKK